MSEHEEVVRLQSELAYQGDALQRLSDAFASQQQDILLLKRQIKLLGEQFAALRDSTPAQQAEERDERPPHY